jgi:adenylate cyclase class IV
MGPSTNIETKVRCSDLDAVARRAEDHGARFAGVFEQRDTYFDVPSGRLKVRGLKHQAPHGEATASAELIAYDRRDAEVPPLSAYTREVVDDPEVLIRRLSREHRVRGVVVKRRDLWLKHRTRIHLDRVQGLGNFVELETVAKESADNDPWREHRRIGRELELERLPRVAVSYIDLLDGTS